MLQRPGYGKYGDRYRFRPR